MQKKGQPMMASRSGLRAVAFGRTCAAPHLTNVESGLH
jgi:hypothetical protein